MMIYNLYFIFLPLLHWKFWNNFFYCIFAGSFFLYNSYIGHFIYKKTLLWLILLYSVFMCVSIVFLRDVALFKDWGLTKSLRLEVWRRQHLIDEKHDYLKNENGTLCILIIEVVELRCVESYYSYFLSLLKSHQWTMG